MPAVFISYSHRDKKYLDELLTHLKAYERSGVVTAWSDRQIAAGTKWFDEIQAALGQAEVAVLLASPDFLASDFIHRHELGPLLQAAETRAGIKLLWIQISACAYTETRLKDLQAVVSPPAEPLAAMRPAERDKAWLELCEEIKKAANCGPAQSTGAAAIPADGQRTRVVAKGLLSYEKEDAPFFLQLLPLPWDRGLPRCVRFWKDRIESRDRERTFRIGLLFGPSGCGKSSLVKAGLIPRLDNAAVLPIYLEATSDDTEARLLRTLFKSLPGLPPDATLGAVLQAAATGTANGRKLLVVLDQFEQWLHAHRAEQDTPLARALQACDGANLQCLLMIRPEFQLAAWRLFDELGVEWIKDANVKLADLFDPPHALAVLTEFGRSYGRLPDRADFLSNDENAFLDQVIAALADADGRIVAVRLALFAEMVKGRPWVPKTLHDVGGAAGVGREFVEENFSRDAAPYRRYKQAASRVLESLLPNVGTDIRGRWQPELSLRQAANLIGPEFERLMKILIVELKLVKGIDPTQDDDSRASSGSEGEVAALALLPVAERYYQLTHDYLVPSLRAWLDAELQIHWRGRAQLVLRDRTAQWQHSRDRRFLPGPLEFLRILAGVPWPQYQLVHRQMLRAAAIWYGQFAAVLAVVLCVAGIGWRELRGISKAEQIVAELFRSRTAEEFNDYLASELVPYSRWATGPLRAEVSKGPVESWREADRIRRGQRRADAAVALWRLGDPDGACQALRVKEDPESLTQFVDRCDECGIAGAALWDQLVKTTNATPDAVTVRYGLILALGEFKLDDIPREQRDQWSRELAKWYRDDRSSAIHSASGWLLRQWGEADVADAVDHTTKPYDPDWEWFVQEVEHNDGGKPDCFTFIVSGPKPGEPPAEFLMGSPNNETGRLKEETRHKVRITRRFAICDREVTNAQFARFQSPREPERDMPIHDHADHPFGGVSWHDAVKYCRWIGERLKLGEPSQCHFGEPRWQFDPRRSGFRLPTEAEWEYACRAGTLTAYSCGSEDQQHLLGKYARFDKYRESDCGGLRPNLLGLFDTHGNVFEWCADWYDKDYYAASPADDPLGPSSGSDRVARGGSASGAARETRSACRNHQFPDIDFLNFGFRLAKTL